MLYERVVPHLPGEPVARTHRTRRTRAADVCGLWLGADDEGADRQVDGPALGTVVHGCRRSSTGADGCRNRPGVACQASLFERTRGHSDRSATTGRWSEGTLPSQWSVTTAWRWTDTSGVTNT